MLAKDWEAAKEEADEGRHHDDEEDGEDLLFVHLLGQHWINGLRANHAKDIHDRDDGRDKSTTARAIA